MCCRYDSSAGAQCLESLENLTCDATEAELAAAQRACDEAWTCPLFECASGDEEISAVWECDGVEDCRDGSDEANCYEIRCEDGDTKIPPSAICDGIADCRDGTDEQGCEEYTCDEGKTVVPASALCDGVVDCNDGLDESNCSN